MPAKHFEQKTSHRLQFRFWLDVTRQEEDELAEYVEYLKEKRSFAQTIREALRLIWDLRAGHVEVLIFLFPWIVEYFANQKTEPLQVQASIPENDPIRDQIARLEQAILQQGGIPIADGIRPSQVLPQPRLLSHQSDDDIAIGVKRVEGTGSVQNNFLKAISAAAGVNFPDETKTPPARRKSRATTRKTAPVLPPAAGIRKLDVQQFVVPTFDDDDDGISLFT